MESGWREGCHKIGAFEIKFNIGIFFGDFSFFIHSKRFHNARRITNGARCDASKTTDTERIASLTM